MDITIVLVNKAKLEPRKGKRFEVWETDEPSAPGVEGIRSVRDDIKTVPEPVF